MPMIHEESNAIETNSGELVDLIDPEPGTINFEDIVAGLSKLPRFVGQTDNVYTVAQHSVNVAKSILSEIPESRGTLKIALAGLLHDAAEAYLGDIPRPYKRMFGRALLIVEERLTRAIFTRFDLDFPLGLPEEVKHADDRWLATERRDLFSRRSKLVSRAEPYAHGVGYCWTPKEAAFRFRTTYTGILARLERAGDR